MMNTNNQNQRMQQSKAQNLIAETLADLRNQHPLVSKLALQRFAAELRRLRSPEMNDLKVRLMGLHASADLALIEQEALQKMLSLVEMALENRSLRMPRMTQPLTLPLPEHFTVVGRGIGEAVGD